MRFLSALVTVVFSLEDLAGLAHSLSIAAEGDMEVTDRRSHMDLPLRGVSTVSCWMDACKAACESRGERGICKYRCQPKLQRFDHCVTKCVCSETNVWPETFEGRLTVSCENWGCVVACINMKKTTGFCEMRRRKKPQGIQASAHCHCVI